MSVCKFRSGNSGSTYTFFAFCSSVQLIMQQSQVSNPTASGKQLLQLQGGSPAQGKRDSAAPTTAAGA